MTNEILVMRKKEGFSDYTEIDLRTSAVRSFALKRVLRWKGTKFLEYSA
jgi:hypothetical protein